MASNFMVFNGIFLECKKISQRKYGTYLYSQYALMKFSEK